MCVAVAAVIWLPRGRRAAVVQRSELTLTELLRGVELIASLKLSFYQVWVGLAVQWVRLSLGELERSRLRSLRLTEYLERGRVDGADSP